MPPSAICWSICCEIPSRNGFDRNSVGIQQRRPPGPFAPDEPEHESDQRGRSDDQEQGRRTRRPPARRGCSGRSRPCPRWTAPLPRRRRAGVRCTARRAPGGCPTAHGDDHDLEPESHPPGQVGGDEAAEQRSDCRRDRRCRADQGVHLLLRRSLEVPVDEGLHSGQQQRGADPAHHRPEDDDRGQATARWSWRSPRSRSRGGPARRPSCAR